MFPVTPKTVSYEIPPGATYRHFKLYRSGFTQKKPYDLLLPLTYTQQKANLGLLPHYDAVNSTGDTNIQSKAWSILDPSHTSFISDYRSFALNDVRKRLLAQSGEAGGLLVTLAEHKQALQMMESRLIMLYRFARHMARFEFDLAAKAVLSRHDNDGWERYHHSRNKGKLKRGSKNLANNYLEMHYGWLPTIGDLYHAAAALSRNTQILDSELVWASGKYRFERIFTNGPRRCVHKGTYRFKAGHRVFMDNPNVYLANEMGLINPYLAVADVIKYSFLLDYVINLNEFCAQFTDYSGLKLVDQWYKETLEDEAKWTWIEPGFFRSGSNSSFSMQRVISGLPSISLSIRKPWQLSARRGGALASLLLTAMPDDPKALQARRLVTRSERRKYEKLGKLGSEYFR